jgi:hypothetical protein
MVSHNASAVDNVLVEWILALVCMKISAEGDSDIKSKIRLSRVFPVMMGVVPVSGSGDKDEGAEEVKVTNLFTSMEISRNTSLLQALPNIAPSATLVKVKSLLSENSIDSDHPLIIPILSLTVKEIVHQLTTLLCFQGWTVPMKSIAPLVAGEVVAILRSIRSISASGKLP